MPLTVGQKAPDFRLSDQRGKEHQLADYTGKFIVLYFYPKDDTPGCTKEACSFRDGLAELRRANIVVLGVSADSVKSHKKFAEKFSLSFPLLSDESKRVVELYGVWGKKKFMGREYLGIFRTTFLIGPDGNIAKIYDNVKPDNHAEQILADAHSFQK